MCMSHEVTRGGWQVQQVDEDEGLLGSSKARCHLVG